MSSSPEIREVTLANSALVRLASGLKKPSNPETIPYVVNFSIVSNVTNFNK